jgi:hypothetical protein
MILILVELIGILLIVWAGWILVWNIRHRETSPQKE